MDYELAPPLRSNALDETSCDTVDVPYELGDSKLHRLRKRQVVAKRAAARSTLCPDITARMLDKDEEWQSEDTMIESLRYATSPTTTTSHPFTTSLTRTKRPHSNHRHETAFVQTPKHGARHNVTMPKTTLARSDQRWINMLERNSEELMSQIQTLTSDANEIEKRLRAQLEAAEHEISCLRDQLVEKEKALKQSKDRNIPRMDHRRTKTEQFHWRAETNPELESRKLLKEKEQLQARCRQQDDELLRAKRRNAELAEQLLHQRGLEITVDGQNRYLLELSAALEETKRVSSSEAASSPRLYSSPTCSDGTMFSPLMTLPSSYMNHRPVSFDGTQWQTQTHLRNHSLPDLEGPPFQASASSQLLSPPLTEKENSPTADKTFPLMDSTQHIVHPDMATKHIFRKASMRPQTLRPSSREHSARPVLQRNESSLWAELHDDLDATDLSSRRSHLSSAGSQTLKQTESNDMSLLKQEPAGLNRASEETRQQAAKTMPRSSSMFVTDFVRVRGGAMTQGMRMLMCGWVWLCFLCLLSMSVARVLSEGPAAIGTGTLVRSDNGTMVEPASERSTSSHNDSEM